MFLGQYTTKFTGLGRVILPKNLRKGLFGGGSVILSRGFEKCIWGYSESNWKKQTESLLETPATEERARILRRYLFSASVLVELDNQGRFVIPPNLLSFASLKEEVAIIGAGDHFEVWDKKNWEKHMVKVEEEYGRIS